MDRGQAWARLKAMTAADSTPVLSTDELDLLLDMHRIADANGVAPGAAGWIGTWDLNRAACEGWKWKGAKVAGNFTFSADGASFNRSEVLANCERMVAQYARRCAASLPIAVARTETADDA